MTEFVYGFLIGLIIGSVIGYVICGFIVTRLRKK